MSCLDALALDLNRTSRRKVRRLMIGSCGRILTLGILHQRARRLVLIGTVLDTLNQEQDDKKGEMGRKVGRCSVLL